ncbi:uncharacterized protein LOC141905017 [Tubulanus polymorphus]|uniref:uncharacterized protein LOC141905017 n=1 Tax=Tubulanus polymorphus TaxID=672921 RepID=UPI003DA5D24B
MSNDHLANVDEVIYSSFLVKSPGKSRSFLGKFGYKAKWRRRYFVLFKPKGSLFGDLQLDYFDNEQRKRHYGSVDLDQTERIISSLDSNQYNYVFAIKTKYKRKDRIYYLAADREETMNNWVEYLCTACGLTPEPEFDMEMPLTTSPSPTSTLASFHTAVSQQNTATSTVSSGHQVGLGGASNPYTPDPTEHDYDDDDVPPVPVPRPRATLMNSRDHSFDRPYIPLDQCISAPHRQSLTSIPDEPPPPPPIGGARNSEQDFYDVPPTHRFRRVSDSGEQDFYDVPPHRYADAELAQNMAQLAFRTSVGDDDVYDVPPPRRSQSLRNSSNSQSSDMPPPRPVRPSVNHRPRSTSAGGFQPVYGNLPSNSKSHPENSGYHGNHSPLSTSPPVGGVFTSSMDENSLYDFPKSMRVHNPLLAQSPPAPGKPQSGRSHAYVNTDNCQFGNKDNSVNNNHLEYNYVNEYTDIDNEEPYQNMGGDSRPESFYQVPPACKVKLHGEMKPSSPTVVTTRRVTPPPIPARPGASKTNSDQLGIGQFDDSGTYDVFPTKRTKSFKKDAHSSPLKYKPPCIPAREPMIPTPVRTRTGSSKSSSSSSEDDHDENLEMYSVLPNRTNPIPVQGWSRRRKEKLQYIDLDLKTSNEEPTFKRSPQPSKSPIEYKEIDFIRTTALQKTKNTVEKNRKDSIAS